MTEEEFKKAMGKTIFFVVIALIILIIIGILVFNNSGKSTSIFRSEKDFENYKKKVEEVNSYNVIEEDVEKIESNSDNSEQENTSQNVNEVN